MGWEIVHWWEKWRSVSRCQAIRKENSKNTPRPGLMLAPAERTEWREKWETEQERGGTQTKNMDENIQSLWRWLAHWRFFHKVCITGFKGVYYSSVRTDHWHKFVGVTANLVVTWWHSITLPPSAQFTRSFHGEIHFDWHTRLQTQSFCSFPL